MDYAGIVATIRRLALEAGAAIMEVYGSARLRVRREGRRLAGDRGRRARRRASSPAACAPPSPAIPLVTEEQAATHGAQRADFFLVDPLDGTKEFVQRRGDFTVNIALIENGVPTRGVVYAPAQGRLFYTDAAGRRRRRPGRTTRRARRADAAAAWPRPTRGARRRRLQVPPRPGDRRLHRALRGRRLQDRRLVAEVLPRGGRRGRPLPAARPDHGMGHRRRAGGAARRRRQVVRFDDHAPLVYGKPGFENPFFIAHAPGRRAARAPDRHGRPPRHPRALRLDPLPRQAAGRAARRHRRGAQPDPAQLGGRAWRSRASTAWWSPPTTSASPRRPRLRRRGGDDPRHLPQRHRALRRGGAGARRGYDVVVNLQGDAPLTPPWFVEALVEAMRGRSRTAPSRRPCCAATPRRSRASSRTAARAGSAAPPPSSTAAGRALYFSKEVHPLHRPPARRRRGDPGLPPCRRLRLPARRRCAPMPAGIGRAGDLGGAGAAPLPGERHAGALRRGRGAGPRLLGAQQSLGRSADRGDPGRLGMRLTGAVESRAFTRMCANLLIRGPVAGRGGRARCGTRPERWRMRRVSAMGMR